MAAFTFKQIQILTNEPLGSGAYGSVYRAKCDHLPCAAKILHPMFYSSNDTAIRTTLNNFHRECSLLSSLQHPNIVQFLGEFTNSVNGQTALLMELMDESLTSYLERHQTCSVPAQKLLNFSHDIALGLHYLHNNSIIHRDLSSNNVLLLKECRVKITDLGVSKLKYAAQQHMTQCPGSPVYMPPEALYQTSNYTEQLDIFSYGILLVQMITCRFPQPKPHEILVPDTASPTGFIKMPVTEVERRAEELSLIADDHMLRPLILRCIADMPQNRPLSSEVCSEVERVKLLPIEGVVNEATPTDVGGIVTERSNEVELLKQDIYRYQEKVKEQDEQLQLKDIELNIAKRSQEELGNNYKERLKEQGNLLEEREEELEKERERLIEIEKELLMEREKTIMMEEKLMQKQQEEEKGQVDERKYTVSSAVDMKVIGGLDPNTVAILSKHKIGELKGAIYGDPDPCSITVLASPNEPLATRITLVMQAYRHFTNTYSFTLDFVIVPGNYPKHELEDILKTYNKSYPHCNLTFNEDLCLVQIVSINQPSLTQAKLQLDHEIRFTIFLPGNRKLSLKKTDIIKEPVTVLVNPANKRLQLNGGLAKVVNIASGGKMQQYCDEYVKNKGILDECGLMKTPAGGDLKCKWVIHVVSPDGSRYTSNKVQSKMIDLLSRCLAQADKLGAYSIAIPAIGTGHLNVNRKLAANAFITAVLDYDYLNDETLREVSICIIDERTFSEFAEVFLERKADIELSYGNTIDFHREFSDQVSGTSYPSSASSCRPS